MTKPTPQAALTRRHWCGLGLASGLGWLGAGGAWAQGRMLRIGETKIASHAALDADEKGFAAGLANAGFKEGVNVRFLRHNAGGDMARAEAIARELVQAKVDLIHAIATPTAQAVMRTGSRIPLVFSSVTDPVRAGLVPANSAPGQKTGTHVTGLSDLWPVQLQMQTYAKAVPHAQVWGTIYNPQEVNSLTHLQAMRAAASRLGLRLVEAQVRSSAEVGPAAAQLAEQVQAIIITSDNTAVVALEAIARVCDERKIALFAGDIDSVARGAVMAYGLDYFLVGYSAGRKAALVLKGISPGDVPWGPVEKFSLLINMRAARAQGVTLSAELLAKADKIIN
jgi:putative tryptophan/tyrosine transport system substrate-binding protein